MTVLTDEELVSVIDDACLRLSISLTGKEIAGTQENGKKEAGAQTDE